MVKRYKLGGYKVVTFPAKVRKQCRWQCKRRWKLQQFFVSATFFGILVNRFLPQKVEISGIALTLSLLTLEIVNSCLLANSDVDKEALFTHNIQSNILNSVKLVKILANWSFSSLSQYFPFRRYLTFGNCIWWSSLGSSLHIRAKTT